MTDFELSEIDKKGLKKGAEIVQPDWWQIVDVSSAEAEGELPSYEERYGGVGLAPLEIDHGIIPPLMKEFLPSVFGDNPTMTTLILDEKGDHIIWAATEYCEGGVYKWVERMDPKGDWTEKVNPKLAEGDFEAAYEEMRKVVDEQFGVELGLIKVARPQFFIGLEKTMEAADWGDDLIGWIPEVMDFGTTIFEEDYINFYPEPYFARFLREVVAPLIEELDGEELEPILRRLMDEPPIDAIIALKARGQAAGLRIKQDSDGLDVDTVKQETSDELYSDDIKELARNYRDEFEEADVVISLNVTDELKELAEQIMTDIPWSDETYYKIGEFVSQIVQTLGEDIWIEADEGWLNLENVLDWTDQLLDYDIREMNLPIGFMVIGMQKALSEHPVGIFVTGEERELLTAMVADFTTDEHKLYTADKEKLDPIFEKDNEDAVTEAAKELSDEYGEIYPAIELKIDEMEDLIGELKKMMKEPKRSPLILMKVLTYCGDIMEKGLNFSESPYELAE